MRSQPVSEEKGKSFKSMLLSGDRVIWIIFLLMCLVSFVEVFSASTSLAHKDGNYWSPIIRHGQMLIGGIFIAKVMQYLPFRVFTIGNWLHLLSIVLLILTLFIGKEINDSKRWLALFGLQFQPSEVAKLTTVIFIAYCLSVRRQYTEARMFRYILIGTFTVAGLIVTENVSTAAYVIIFSYVLMFIGGISAKRMISLTLVIAFCGALFAGSLFTMKDEWIAKYNFLQKSKNRILEFSKPSAALNPETYVITDYNRQETYSKIAIANGSSGMFPGMGQQRSTLPLAYADYIYAIIIEELSVAGGIIIMILYIVLLFRVGRIAQKCDKLFPKYLVMGCGLMIGMQAFMNMASVVGLFPVMGQPLPLISHGGTSTIITCTYFGIILSVSHTINKEDEKVDEEEEDDLPSPSNQEQTNET
ncbi:MAG: FtsW/RodA/SpoVE family cell cycle protein [Tannerellaceae bacterium]|jgi:cell division protein FtsW|nr:FtsW/RodA/SpoVE family cell cycle protein [Tannerellaceae bacterium]